MFKEPTYRYYLISMISNLVLFVAYESRETSWITTKANISLLNAMILQLLITTRHQNTKSIKFAWKQLFTTLTVSYTFIILDFVSIVCTRSNIFIARSHTNLQCSRETVEPLIWFLLNWLWGLRLYKVTYN